MRVAFRTDASVDIGTGHVMRCLTLADELRRRGSECVFICRPHRGHLIDLLQQRGHQVIALAPLTGSAVVQPGGTTHAHWLGTDWQQDAKDVCEALQAQRFDWLVVDHYAIAEGWERMMRSLCRRLMVIDDLADRAHNCDLLLDQNLGRIESDYSTLLPVTTLALVGPKYALLRPDFARLREESLARRSPPHFKQLLIAMGGVDKDDITTRVLRALDESSLPSDIGITVVMGPKAPWLERIRDYAHHSNRAIQVAAGINDMAQRMVDSDLAIGAAGSTSWERCCLGLPTVQIVVAENQRSAAAALADRGAVVTLALNNHFSDQLCGLIDLAYTDMSFLEALSRKAAAICDGQGAARVADTLEKMNLGE